MLDIIFCYVLLRTVDGRVGRRSMKFDQEGFGKHSIDLNDE
jgi:hypothetical protein